MDLDEQAVKELFKQVVTYEDGDLIFAEGTAGGWVYIVALGEVEVFRTVGDRKIIIDRVYKGECLGEVSFFDKHVRSASARAVGRVGLMQFKDEVLAQEYKKLPDYFKVVLESLALRLRAQLKKVSSLLSNPKIYALLMEETKPGKDRN
ncbi:MAG: cyclic nucleotide-binding domain-containing protein [Deltaproteobacteria bacterium]|nr:cyclic nucleotide-binding domain-containing protein [Deltaproteobacteria bacterium]